MTRRNILVTMIYVFALAMPSVIAQTTAFTHQGSLRDGSSLATGNYDFEFRLFDAASGGTLQGATAQRLNIAVVNGIFTVSLDFGAGVLPGANRFLDISVRAAGGGAFTQLAPRQPVTSAPYAVKSLNSENAANAATAQNAQQLGGVAANQFVQTADPRLSDARPPTPGSTDYIRNGTSTQAASSFSISGTGRADIFNATTQYELGGSVVLRRLGSAGLSIGSSNSDSVGEGNLFIGSGAGGNNTNGFSNTFAGRSSGVLNSTGDLNSFFGVLAGNSNTTGNRNTIIGSSADVASENLSYATAIGAESIASQSNSLYLGRPGGEDAVRIPGATIISGSLVVDTMGSSSGAVPLCRNSANRLSLCPASSLRYKTNIQPVNFGLDIVRRLKPVTFDWTDGGMHDFGLVAEEVAAVEPLLVIYQGGKIEGVKYDRIGVVLVNAIKEQQAQIERQQRIIDDMEQRDRRQTQAIDALREMVCGKKSRAAICKE